jgi:adenylate kinase family enzyme
MSSEIVLTEKLSSSIGEYHSLGNELQQNPERLAEMSVNGAVELVRTKVENIANTILESEVKQTFEVDPDQKKEYYEKLLDSSAEFLLDYWESIGLKHILFTTPGGIQGAGKGTYIPALISAAHDFFARFGDFKTKDVTRHNKALSFRNLVTLLTGTKGIWNHSTKPENIDEQRYFDMFSPIADNPEISNAKEGIFVDDELVNVSVVLGIIEKSVEAHEQFPTATNSAIQLDLFPRSPEQQIVIDILQKKLAERNGGALIGKEIHLAHEVLDLKLMSQESAEIIYARSTETGHEFDNRKISLEISKRVSQEMNAIQGLIKRSDLPAITDYLQFTQNVTTAINATRNWLERESDIKDLETANQILDSYEREIAESARRIGGRFEKTQRIDDSPSKLFGRVADFHKKTMPYLLSKDSVKAVSTLGSPAEISERFIRKFFHISEYNYENSFIHVLEGFMKNFAYLRVQSK